MICTSKWGSGNTSLSELNNLSTGNWYFQGKVCNYSELLRLGRASRCSLPHSSEAKVSWRGERLLWKPHESLGGITKLELVNYRWADFGILEGHLQAKLKICPSYCSRTIPNRFHIKLQNAIWWLESEPHAPTTSDSYRDRISRFLYLFNSQVLKDIIKKK